MTNDPAFPALSLLNKIPGFLKAVNLVCDIAVEEQKFKYNAVKLNKWIRKRFEILMETLKSYDGVSEAIKSSGNHSLSSI